MQEKELRLVFESGDLIKASVISNPMDTGYLLSFYRKSTDNPIVMHSFRDKQGRVFKTIDSAVKCACRIGFKDITVTLQ